MKFVDDDDDDDDDVYKRIKTAVAVLPMKFIQRPNWKTLKQKLGIIHHVITT